MDLGISDRGKRWRGRFGYDVCSKAYRFIAPATSGPGDPPPAFRNP